MTPRARGEKKTPGEKLEEQSAEEQKAEADERAADEEPAPPPPPAPQVKETVREDGAAPPGGEQKPKRMPYQWILNWPTIAHTYE